MHEQIVQNPKVYFEVLILSYIMFLLNATFFHKYQLFWMVTDNTQLGRKSIYVEHELYRVVQNERDKRKMYHRLK